MNETQKESKRRLAALEFAYQNGAITMAVEPKSWAYPAPFRRGKNAEAFYAVYGSAAALQALDDSGCLVSNASRPRVDTDELSKAYLRNDLAQEFLRQQPVDLQDECQLLGLSADPGEPILAFYHTRNATTDGDTLSYLIMSARDAQRFEYPVKRLTDETRLYATMSHIGRPVGEFVLIPIRRSMAQVIARSHPNAIDITRDPAQDPLAHSDVIKVAMPHILSQQQNDTRFHWQPKERKRIEAQKVKPVLPTPIASKPLEAYLEALRPHIEEFQRTEQFSGGFSTRMVCRPSSELFVLLAEMRDPRYCEGAGDLSILQENSTRHDSQVLFKISQKTYEAIRRHSGASIAESHATQKFKSSWIAPMPMHYKLNDKDKKGVTRTERIKSLRLVSHMEGAHQQHWLVFSASTLRRGHALAHQMTGDASRAIDLSQPEEKPALLRIPLSARMAQQLTDSSEEFSAPELITEETPYDSLQALDAEQREHAGVRVPALGAEKEDEKTEPAAPVKLKRTEAEIRAAAARILFPERVKAEREKGDFQIKRAQLFFRFKRKDDDKRSNDEPVEEICLGLKIPAAQAHDFEEALQHSGFRGLSGRRLVWAGKTASIESYHLYELRITKADALAWAELLANDPVLSASADAHAPFIGSDAVNEAIRSHFKEAEIKVDPIEAAWKHLAGLARQREMQCLDVRFDAEAIKHMETDFARQLSIVKSLAGMRHTADSIVAQWDERFPLFLHPDLDAASRELHKSLRHRFKGPLNDLDTNLHDIETQLKQYKQWFLSQPKQPDGSIVLPYLVIPDPRSQSPFHLQQLAATPYKPEGAEKDDPGVALFPQAPMTIDGAMAQGKEVLLVPVYPAFFEAFAANHGRVAVLGEEPVAIGKLPYFLRERFYEAQAEAPAEPTTNVVDLNQESARNRLLEGGLEKCRNMMLYGALREEHDFEDLAAEREHIGTQHALMLQLNDRSDWTQKAVRMLEDMKRAGLLERRRRYGPLVDVPLPPELANAQAHEHQARDAREFFENSEFLVHLEQLAKGGSASLHLPILRRAAQTLYDAIEHGQLPRDNLRLHSVLRFIAQSTGDIGQDYLNNTVTLAREAYQGLRAQHNLWHNTVLDLSMHYNLDADSPQKAASITKDDEVLFFVEGEENGLTMDEVTRRVRMHFDEQRNNAPLRVVTYMGAQQGQHKNQKLIEMIKRMPPQREIRGKFSARAAQRPLASPENVTLRQFFEEASRHFGVSSGQQRA